MGGEGAPDFKVSRLLDPVLRFRERHLSIPWSRLGVLVGVAVWLGYAGLDARVMAASIAEGLGHICVILLFGNLGMGLASHDRM